MIAALTKHAFTMVYAPWCLAVGIWDEAHAVARSRRR